jgi:hypothetical protein
MRTAIGVLLGMYVGIAIILFRPEPETQQCVPLYDQTGLECCK